MCVLQRPGWIVLSDIRAHKLLVFDAGTIEPNTRRMLRFIGSRRAANNGTSFRLTTGGICAAAHPDGQSVLVADGGNRRVVEVNAATGVFTRVIPIADEPAYVDCDTEKMVVACGNNSTLYIVSWTTGSVLRRLTWPNTGAPLACRLTPDGAGVLIATAFRNTVVIMNVSGSVRWQRCAGVSPGVLLCRDHMLLATPTALARVSWKTKQVIDSVDLTTLHIGAGTVRTLQCLSDGGVAVHVEVGERAWVVVCRGRDLRIAWLTAVLQVHRRRPTAAAIAFALASVGASRSSKSSSSSKRRHVSTV
jgi:hypothetical protein